ncbi:hypothetical protein KK083_15940 [Fulvivirgaceae bacterium PWU4]|uniref:DUF3300 domain-containing protein n=1 Tax=Chryseosolibacter histidini TaxID=2782349 RepID=A0AAP2DLD4_9BACT|nr:hypothetical protein [Chryseosolibacter histidini]MBT1698381.1 hypothetical protein [Chryseosolibacter histidini]
MADIYNLLINLLQGGAVMEKHILPYAVVAMSLLNAPAFSQSVADSTLLGLPGDNLDLYAVLDLFQKSRTIEEFEKSLNLEKTGINNLDLDLDKKVDFIKVVTKQEKEDFTFILQVAVSETETQDVAVILVSKDKDKKISMQIVGDEDLYGKNYIVELRESSTPPVTANPGYQGPDTVKIVTVPAQTTTVVVEQAPIVQYVYSPAYVPYYPPYHYGYYPPYFAAFTVMAIGVYWGSHAHYHHHGYGYHGNTTVIHNTNNFNNYNRTRNTSNTVNRNKASGNYDRSNGVSTRPSTRPSGGASPATRESGGRQSSNRQAGGASPSTRQARPTREAAGSLPSNRQSDFSSQRSKPSSAGASRYSGGYGGGSRGGGFSGGGSRGGGGRRR